MKNLVLFVLIILSFANCREDKTTNSVEQLSYKKDKYLVESQRDVESLDSLIEVENDDLERIRIRIFPSFEQGHSITYSTRDHKIGFYQITQTLNRTEDYYKIPEGKREYHLYEFMKKNSSQNFQHEIMKEEEKVILKHWEAFKKANYQFKNVEMMDGAEFFTSIYERDTIVYVNTNSPSTHQTKLLKTLFELCEKYTEDSITKRNISRLKEYL
ncbi:hypothetical protein [Moheibacter lacus]|uniref:Uncharacterized protein n=1 Tax=Moheibacter lacus TaxID=2745851 RepID=A0A838ZTX9_9FLAO|nr:hypothetical protein [Moheibacter lacus]MBA5630448.1 hypothetical protein [Moheibacter lacus]